MRALIVAALLLGALNVQPAHAQPSGPCSGASSYIRPAMGQAEITKRVRQVERCVTHRWPVPGGVAKLDYIIERESGRYPWAKNPNVAGACHFTTPYGSCGLAQHQMVYWAGRVRSFLPRAYYPRRWPLISPMNARANLIVTVRMIRSSGWGAWGG